MNIAIVDDEKAELDAAEHYLKDYLRDNWSGTNVNIQTFSSAKDFLNVFKVGAFQLVILDIIMPEINGLQAAQIIRARGDDDVNIVFLTSSEDFILNGYRVFAIGYFIKPITAHIDDFTRTFEHILPKLCRKNPKITLKVENAAVKVPFKNILYIELDYRQRLCVYLAEGRKFVTRNNYSELAPILLADERFLECYHRIIGEVKVKYMRYFAGK